MNASAVTGIELLAPARDLVCGRAAVDAGADAVYIGAPRFGARAKASNALSDIRALVSHAHRYWARIYVTVNTLLYDHELVEATDLIHQLYEIGVDAIIVHDGSNSSLYTYNPPAASTADTSLHAAVDPGTYLFYPLASVSFCYQVQHGGKSG